MAEHSVIPAQQAVTATAAANSRMFANEKQQKQDELQGLHNNAIQFKLIVGSPDDPLEHEADAMADNIMRMPEQHFIQRKCGCEDEEHVQRKPLASFIQRKCSHCEAEDIAQRKPLASFIQRKESSTTRTAPEAISNQIYAGRGNGSSMDSNTQSFMQSRFGSNFGEVKIHTGNEAIQMNRELNAKAFTVGRDIYFNEGQYNPGSDEGKHLLAHELTHTIQQSSGNDINRQAIQRKGFSLKCEKLVAKPSLVGMVGGTLVHTEIAAHFRSTVKGAHGIAIPGAKADPFRTDALCGGDSPMIDPEEFDDNIATQDYGKPDLARLDKGILEVAEIKPASLPCLVDGIPQLARYIEQGNETDEAILKWKAKRRILAVIPMKPSTYKPVSLEAGGYKIEVAWCAPGLLAYNITSAIKKEKKPKEEEPEEGKKPKEGEEGKKPKEGEGKKPGEGEGKKPGEPEGKKPNASAENVGFGISILSTSVGGGNAGIGVSVMSNGASVCTASAGFVYDSNGAAIGTASAGVSIGTDSAGALSVGAGYSKDSTTAGAATVSIGKSEGDTAAGAVSASAGSSKDATVAGAVTAAAGQSDGATGATAVKAGTPGSEHTSGSGKDGKNSPGGAADTKGGKSADDLKSAIDAAVKLDASLQQASPAQKSLMIALSQHFPGHAFPISKAEWIGKIIFATSGLKDEDLKYLENFPWQEGHMTKEELKENIQKIVAQKDGGTLTYSFGSKITIPLQKNKISGWKMNSLSLPINSQISPGTVVKGTMLLKFEKTDKTNFMLQLNEVELRCSKVEADTDSIYYFDFTQKIEIYDASNIFIDQANGIYAANDFIDWQ